MNTSTIIGLVNNAALLLALGILYDMVGYRPQGGKPSIQQAVTGVILGVIGIAVMLTPWQFAPGVLFDTRSVLLSVSGLFFGVFPTLLATLMTSAFRLYNGGVGAWTGVAVIVTSGAIGVAWRHLRRRKLEDMSIGELYAMGLVVHIAMLLWMFSLPWPLPLNVLSQVSLPVMAIYPVGTALLSRLMVNQGARKQAEEALRASKEQFETAITRAPIPMVITDTNQGIVLYNNKFTELFGYTLEDVSTAEEWWLTAYPDEAYRQLVQKSWEAAIVQATESDSEIEMQEWDLTIKDGSVRRVEFKMTPLSEILLIAMNDITERKQAEQSLRKANRAYKVLSDCNQALIRATEETKLLQEVCRIIVEVGGYRLAWVGFAEEDEEKTVRPVAQMGYEEGYLDTVNITWADTERGRGPTGTAIRTGRPSITKNILTNPDYAPWRSEATKRGYALSIALPLLTDGQALGALNIYAPEPNAFDDEEVGLLMELAGDLAFGIMTLRTRIEHKRAEEALRESEEKFRTLTVSSPVGMFLNDAQGNAIYINEKCAELVGMPAEEALSLDWVPAIHPDDRERVTTEWAKAVKDGEEFHLEYRWVHADGEVVWTLGDIVPVRGSDGEVTVYIGTLTDITERKQAEEALRQLNQAIEQSPVSVVITDTEGAIQYINPKFSQVTGYSAAEAIGQNRRILQSGEHPPEYYREFWDTITAGQEWQGEFRNKKKNGELYWEMAFVAGVKDQSGTITHYVMVAEDITQRKQREEEHIRQERLAAVGQLATGIAHDFNNVMAVITLYSDLLQRSTNLSKDDLKKLQTIYQQAMHAADLTRQILDFSRRSVREPRPLDLKAFLNEMLKFVARTIPERIQVQCAFPPGDYTVNADPTQLQQAVTNLTVNARDAMPRGGALNFNLSRLTLRAGETPPGPDMEPGEWVKLAVTDTGTGIAPGVLPHIFEPFFTTKEVGKGTGLGLAQVYGIVQQHEGCITVDSRLGEGTTFTIYLPALMIETAVKTAKPLTAVPQGQGETILLVEDNQILLEATHAILESLNYRVLTAADGQDALTVYRAQPNQIKLILADVVMPKMDGFELVKALQQQSPSPKVLLMSGFPRDMEMTPEMKRLVSGWLPKPLDLRQLARLLREALT